MQNKFQLVCFSCVNRNGSQPFNMLKRWILFNLSCHCFHFIIPMPNLPIWLLRDCCLPEFQPAHDLWQEGTHKRSWAGIDPSESPVDWFDSCIPNSSFNFWFCFGQCGPKMLLLLFQIHNFRFQFKGAIMNIDFINCNPLFSSYIRWFLTFVEYVNIHCCHQ